MSVWKPAKMVECNSFSQSTIVSIHYTATHLSISHTKSPVVSNGASGKLVVECRNLAGCIRANSPSLMMVKNTINGHSVHPLRRNPEVMITTQASQVCEVCSEIHNSGCDRPNSLRPVAFRLLGYLNLLALSWRSPQMMSVDTGYSRSRRSASYLRKCKSTIVAKCPDHQAVKHVLNCLCTPVHPGKGGKNIRLDLPHGGVEITRS